MRSHLTLIISIFALVSGGAWFLLTSRSEAKVHSATGPTSQQITLFQSEAHKACACTDRLGDKANDHCWAHYNAITKPFKPNTLMAACLYRTTIIDVFPGTDQSVSLSCRAARENAELAKAAGSKSSEC